MKSRPTIFLSGVSGEFGAFRDAAENEIEMKGCFAENQPGFPPDYRTVEEMLTRKIGDADAVICIIGFRFGQEPKNRPPGVPRRSYTQMEYDIARKLDKPVYVFLPKSADVRQPAKPDEQTEDAEAVQLQLAHRDAVKGTNYLRYSFGDLAELCKLAAEIPPVAAFGFRADISRILPYVPAQLIGRQAELQLLADSWGSVRHAKSPRAHVITFVALGGEGKTSLVAKWTAGLAGDDWPGCDAAFAWSFYSQGTREQNAASSDPFLAAALTFFGDPAMAGSPALAWDKGRRLAELVGDRRALLILDGLEPLQYPPANSALKGHLKDQGITALLTGLAAKSAGLCVVTTRYSVTDLKSYWQSTAPEVKLLRLLKEAGVDLLQKLGVRKSSGTQAEFEKLVEDVKGHALTLNLLGKFLHDAHTGDIRKRDLVRLEEADDEEQAGHAFRVMDAYVAWFESEGDKGKRAVALLRLLGLFDRPATGDCIAALMKKPPIPGLTDSLAGLSDAQRNVVLTRLEEAHLLTVDRDGAGTLLSLDAHPHIREYFAKRLLEGQPAAWQAGHKRVYEHLCEATKDKPKPTLEDLQPLYQAIAHGCHAGMQQTASYDVYRDRILRSNEFYSTRMLGAFGADLGAVACFFEPPWSRVSSALSEAEQAWLLNLAAFRLRALGRLTEAVQPMRTALELGIKQEGWKSVAVLASNLSELELTLGMIADSVRDAERAVDYAARSGDAFQQISKSTRHGDALHHAGLRAKALKCFSDAEGMQAAWQPKYPLLYSLAGFFYCDLLLANAERATWQRVFDTSAQASLVGQHLSLALQDCKGVETRAKQMLEWERGMRGAPILDFALHHLMLGRASLYGAILGGREIGPARADIEQAVHGLRQAGQQDDLPRGLLTRAWLRFLQGDRAAAEADLNEAYEIAERGPMPLHVADVHLYRARLFRDRDELQKARILIDKHGWERRRDELNDAEAALKP